MAEDRILTDKILKDYQADMKNWPSLAINFLRGLRDEQDLLTANYYESVVIPERDRTLIEEIEAGFDRCTSCVDEGGSCIKNAFSEKCLWWQQLKQKRGI